MEGSGVEVGLHLEANGVPLAKQVERFEDAFGRQPTHIDGHHHCHSSGPIAVEVANLARERGCTYLGVDASPRAVAGAGRAAGPAGPGSR